MIDIPFHIPNIPKNMEDIFSKSVHSGWLTTGSQVHKLENKLTPSVFEIYLSTILSG